MRKIPVTAILLTTALALGAFNTSINLYAIAGQKTRFPTGNLIQITTQYAYGGPQPNSLTIIAGDSAQFTLTITNAANQIHTVLISYNATNPEQWTSYGTGGSDTPILGTLTMSINGIVILPENSPLCNNIYSCTAAITVQPGTNTLNGQITATSTANLEAFQLFWFATPQ